MMPNGQLPLREIDADEVRRPPCTGSRLHFPAFSDDADEPIG